MALLYYVNVYKFISTKEMFTWGTAKHSEHSLLKCITIEILSAPDLH